MRSDVEFPIYGSYQYLPKFWILELFRFGIFRLGMLNLFTGFSFSYGNFISFPTQSSNSYLQDRDLLYEILLVEFAKFYKNIILILETT
jgi:hypothetical protein